MAASGFFQDSRDAAQAVVKIMAGREMGFGPFAAMTGVYIIQGRPSIGANLMAAAVKKSGRYDYRVVEMTSEKCAIDFFQGKDVLGRSTFTLDEAKKAGTKNLDKFPRNMLFARAMSNGCRWYCPDVFNGAAVYTPEELGANVNEDGEVIESTFTATPATAPAEPPAQKQHAPSGKMGPSGEQLPPDDVDVPITYTGATAVIIKGGYLIPKEWAKALASSGFSSLYEVDGIMKKVRLPQNTPVEKVVQRVRDWLAAKDAKIAAPDSFQDDEELEMSIDPSDGLPFGDK